MIESASIARYLLLKYDKSYSLYPKDLLSRQKIDAMLDINATVYRPVFMNSYWDMKLSQICFGIPEASPKLISKFNYKINENLKDINSILSLDTFLAGDKKSIADIQVYNEVINVAYHLELDLKKYSNVNKWVNTMQEDRILTDLDEEMKQSFRDIIQMYKEALLKEKN